MEYFDGHYAYAGSLFDLLMITPNSDYGSPIFRISQLKSKAKPGKGLVLVETLA
jgi:hypothetical protein